MALGKNGSNKSVNHNKTIGKKELNIENVFFKLHLASHVPE